MRVAIISTYPPLHDGIAWVTYFFAHELAKIIDVTVVVNKNANHDSHVRVSDIWERGKLRSLLKVLRYCLREKPDLVHVQFHPALYGRSYHSIFMVMMISLLVKKTVLEMHTVRVLSQTRRFTERFMILAFVRFLAYFVDIIVVHTSGMKKALIYEYALTADRIFIIPFGLQVGEVMDSDESKKLLGLEEKMIILNSSLLRKGSGVEEVIACLPKVVKRIPNLTYVAVAVSPSAYDRGFEERRKIQQLIERYNVQNKVLLLNSGFFEHSSVWINASDALTFLHETYPSEDASFSIFKDAVAYRKPVIISDAPKFREIANILRKLGADKLVIPNCLSQEEKVERMAEAIFFLYAREDIRKSISMKFDELSKNRTWNQLAKEMIRIYELVASKNERTRRS